MEAQKAEKKGKGDHNSSSLQDGLNLPSPGASLPPRRSCSRLADPDTTFVPTQLTPEQNDSVSLEEEETQPLVQGRVHSRWSLGE